MSSHFGLEKHGAEVPDKLVPRVVVYGQLPYRRLPDGESQGGGFAGSTQVIEALTRYLTEHGISDDGLVQSRQIDNVTNVFFRGQRSDRPKQEEITDRIPDLVFVLPEMRGYSGSGNYSTGTPVEAIGELCAKHGVPMFVFNEGTAPDELTGGLDQLLASTPLALKPAPDQV